MNVAKKPAELVILFADVCGSTGIYEKLGDTQASACIGECLRRLEDSGRAHGGELVKTIGDEVLMIFDQPDAAAAAARDMHVAIAGMPAQPGAPLAIHIGLHHGAAVRRNGDAFGDAVNVAARLVSLAKGGQSLTTATTLELLAPEWRSLARPIDDTRIRGKAGKVTLFELLWEPDDATRMVDRSRIAQPAGARLRLRQRDRAIELGSEHPIATLGRADSCDLVIKHDLASRLHARIEYRKDRFLLTDLSTNGTFIAYQSGEQLFVRRDTQVLHEAGIIGLGQALTEDSPDAIHFARLP